MYTYNLTHDFISLSQYYIYVESKVLIYFDHVLLLLYSFTLNLYEHVNNLFLCFKAHFKVYLSYILSCNLKVGILIIVLIIMCKCFRLLCASEWQQWLDIWRINKCCISIIIIIIIIIRVIIIIIIIWNGR